MKVDEDVLRGVLREAINDANQKKSSADKVKELMYNMYNVTSGETAFILNGKTPVELMQKDMLFKVTKVLFELNKRPEGTFDFNKLNIDDYFTDTEKDLFSVKIDRNEQDEDIIIKAGNWMQVEDDQYVIKIYPDELMDTYINRNKINYNPETQRSLTIKETKTGKIKMITFFEQSYSDICDAMGNNLYISDMLALNVNPDLYAPPRVVRGNLVIPNESKIDCIDGYHRLKAAITTKLRNPNWNKPLTFYLFICDSEKAIQYILQQDKKNHLTEEQTLKADVTDAVNFIIDKLNDSKKFILRNTINESKYTAINKTIVKIFKPNKLYTPEDRQNAVQLYQNIEQNINDLIEQNNLFGTEITKEMWFIYLNTLKYCLDNNLEFVEIVNKLDIENVLKEINFLNTPSPKHYKIMSEVLRNV